MLSGKETCLKLMIPFFYGHSSKSEYAVECVDYILKTEVTCHQLWPSAAGYSVL